MIKIIIVDDHDFFRSAVKSFLSDKEKYRIIGEASNGEEFLENLEKKELPDIVLMDVRMPKMNGMIATKIVTNSYDNRIKVIALTMHEDFEYLKGMIEAGISGYLNKNNMVGQLEKAINTVLSGNLYFPDKLNYN